jgi:hypothetical protein
MAHQMSNEKGQVKISKISKIPAFSILHARSQRKKEIILDFSPLDEITKIKKISSRNLINPF